MRGALVAVLLVLGLAACTGAGEDGPDPSLFPGEPDVQVDTPKLRKIKARIGMQDCRPGTGSEVEGGLPSLTLECLGGGQEVDLSTLRGPMVINLWASWCGPCEKEMPALEAFHQQYGDRVAILGIDTNDVRPAAALELAEDTGVTYPSLADPGGEIFAEKVFAFARRGFPGFVFVNEDGTVAGFELGGVDSSTEVVDLVEEHLGVTL